MADRKTKKELKKFDKKMAELEKLYEQLEIKPCNNDKELKEKEQALIELRAEINDLEKGRDRLMYTWWEKKWELISKDQSMKA